jgi:hypothetical protein
MKGDLAMDNNCEPEAGQQPRRRLVAKWKVGLAVLAMTGAATFGLAGQASAGVRWDCRTPAPVVSTEDADTTEDAIALPNCGVQTFGVRW